MRRLEALLVLCVIASALSGSTSAATRPDVGKGIQSVGTAGWPTLAAQLAKNIATASFARKYDTVWAYLHPTYRQAISQSNWQRCQRSHPAAPRSVTITKVAVAKATELPVNLSLLGQRNVQEIELLVQFKTPAAAGTQYAVLYTFLLKNGGRWTAVWLSEEYQAYKAGTCYLTPQGPPLY